MSDDNKKAPKTEIVYEPAVRPFTENDYIYRFRTMARTETENGTGQEIIIPAFNATELAKSGEGKAFADWCQKNYKCTIQDYLACAQKQIGTRPQYDKAASIEENQKLADEFTLEPTVRASGVKVKREEKVQLDVFSQQAVDAGFVDENGAPDLPKFNVYVASLLAKKAKK